MQNILALIIVVFAVLLTFQGFLKKFTKSEGCNSKCPNCTLNLAEEHIREE